MAEEGKKGFTWKTFTDGSKGVAKNIFMPIAPAMTNTISSAFMTMSDVTKTSRGLVNLVRKYKREGRNSREQKLSSNLFKQALSDLQNGTFSIDNVNSDMYDDYESETSGDFEIPKGEGAETLTSDELNMQASKGISKAVIQSTSANLRGLQSVADVLVNTQIKTSQGIVNGISNTLNVNFNILDNEVSKMNQTLNTTNALLASLVEFQNKNTVTFYNKSIAMMNGIGEGVEAMHNYINNPGIQKRKFDTSNGINFKDYASYVKEGIQTTIATMFGGGALSPGTKINGKLHGSSSALGKGGIVSGIVGTIFNKFMPVAFQKSVDKMEGTFKAFFDEALMKLDDFTSKLGFTGVIGNSRNIKNGLNMGAYHKDALPWNGIAQKALTEVIPDYLASIEAAIKGQQERYYDYKKGQYYDRDELEERMRKEYLSIGQTQMQPLFEEVRKMAKAENLSQTQLSRVLKALENGIDDRSIARNSNEVKVSRNRMNMEMKDSGLSEESANQIAALFNSTAERMVETLNQFMDDIGKTPSAYNHLNNRHGREFMRNIDMSHYNRENSYDVYKGLPDPVKVISSIQSKYEMTGIDLSDDPQTKLVVLNALAHNAKENDILVLVNSEYQRQVNGGPFGWILNNKYAKGIKSRVSTTATKVSEGIERATSAMNSKMYGKVFDGVDRSNPKEVAKYQQELRRLQANQELYKKETQIKSPVRSSSSRNMFGVSADLESTVTTRIPSLLEEIRDGIMNISVGGGKKKRKNQPAIVSSNEAVNEKAGKASSFLTRRQEGIQENTNSAEPLELITDKATSNIDHDMNKGQTMLDRDDDIVNKNAEKVFNAPPATTTAGAILQSNDSVRAAMGSMTHSFRQTASRLFGKEGIIKSALSAAFKPLWDQVSHSLWLNEDAPLHGMYLKAKEGWKEIKEKTKEKLRSGYDYVYDKAMAYLYGTDADGNEIDYRENERYKNNTFLSQTLNRRWREENKKLKLQEEEAKKARAAEETGIVSDLEVSNAQRQGSGTKVSDHNRLGLPTKASAMPKVHSSEQYSFEEIMGSQTNKSRLPELKVSSKEEYTPLKNPLAVFDGESEKKIISAKETIDESMDKTAAAVKNLNESTTEMSEALGGDVEKSPKEKRKQYVKTFLDKFKSTMPKALIAGGAGAAVGMLNGLSGGSLIGSLFLPGGPIGGAIVGSGLAILSSSETFKKILLGEKDEDGNRQGGIISANLQKSFKKALPTMVGGAAVGAVTGLLKGALGFNSGIGLLGMQLLPGGILGGAIMGMGLGMIKNSDKFKDMLFGKKDENGKRHGTWISKGFNSLKEKFKGTGKGISGAAKGGAIGALSATVISNMGFLPAMLSIGGPVGWGIAGMSMGLLNSTKKFNEFLWGSQQLDKDGNPIPGKRNKDGLFTRVGNLLKVNVIEPIAISFKKNMLNLVDWTKDAITYPFRKAFGPILDSIVTIKDQVVDFVKDKFDILGNGISAMIKGTLKAIFSPVTKLVGFLGKSIGGIGSMMVKTTLAPLSVFLKGAQFLTMGKRFKPTMQFTKDFYLGTGKGDGYINRQKQMWAAKEQEGEHVGIFQRIKDVNDAMHRRGDLYDTARAGWAQGHADEYGQNNLNWMMVEPEKRDMHARRKLRKQDDKKWERIDKLRTKIVNSLGGREVNFNTDTFKLYQKKFLKLGVDEDLLQNADDMRRLLFEREGFKAKTDERLGMIDSSKFMHIDPEELKAQQGTETNTSEILKLLRKIYKEEEEVGNDRAEDKYNDNAEKKSRREVKRFKRKLKRNNDHKFLRWRNNYTFGRKDWKDPALRDFNLREIDKEIIDDFLNNADYDDFRRNKDFTGYLEYRGITHKSTGKAGKGSRVDVWSPDFATSTPNVTGRKNDYRDYYSILGINDKAANEFYKKLHPDDNNWKKPSRDDINKYYKSQRRSMQMRYHPDMYEGLNYANDAEKSTVLEAVKRMQSSINGSYDRLVNPDKFTNPNDSTSFDPNQFAKDKKLIESIRRKYGMDPKVVSDKNVENSNEPKPLRPWQFIKKHRAKVAAEKDAWWDEFMDTHKIGHWKPNFGLPAVASMGHENDVVSSVEHLESVIEEKLNETKEEITKQGEETRVSDKNRTEEQIKADKKAEKERRKAEKQARKESNVHWYNFITKRRMKKKDEDKARGLGINRDDDEDSESEGEDGEEEKSNPFFNFFKKIGKGFGKVGGFFTKNIIGKAIGKAFKKAALGALVYAVMGGSLEMFLPGSTSKMGGVIGKIATALGNSTVGGGSKGPSFADIAKKEGFLKALGTTAKNIVTFPFRKLGNGANWIMDNTGPFGEALRSGVNWLDEKFQPVKKLFGDIFDWINNTLAPVLDPIKEGWTKFHDNILAPVGAWIDKQAEPWINDFWGTLKALPEKLMLNIADKAQFITEWVAEHGTAFGEAMGKAITNLTPPLVNLMAKIAPTLGKVLVEVVKGSMGSILDIAKGVLGGVVHGLTGWDPFGLFNKDGTVKTPDAVTSNSGFKRADGSKVGSSTPKSSNENNTSSNQSRTKSQSVFDQFAIDNEAVSDNNGYSTSSSSQTPVSDNQNYNQMSRDQVNQKGNSEGIEYTPATDENGNVLGGNTEEELESNAKAMGYTGGLVVQDSDTGQYVLYVEKPKDATSREVTDKNTTGTGKSIDAQHLIVDGARILMNKRGNPASKALQKAGFTIVRRGTNLVGKTMTGVGGALSMINPILGVPLTASGAIINSATAKKGKLYRAGKKIGSGVNKVTTGIKNRASNFIGDIKDRMKYNKSVAKINDSTKLSKKFKENALAAVENGNNKMSNKNLKKIADDSNTSYITKFVNWVKKKIGDLATDSGFGKAVSKVLGSKAATGIKKIISTMAKGVDGLLNFPQKLGGIIAKKIGAFLGKAAGGTFVAGLTAGLSELIMAGVGAVFGALDAPSIFGVSDADCTGEMRGAAAILNALFSTTIGGIFDFVISLLDMFTTTNIREELTTVVYRLVTGFSEEAMSKLKLAKSNFDSERIIYNAMHGTNYTEEEYREIGAKTGWNKGVDGVKKAFGWKVDDGSDAREMMASLKKKYGEEKINSMDQAQLANLVKSEAKNSASIGNGIGALGYGKGFSDFSVKIKEIANSSQSPIDKFASMIREEKKFTSPGYGYGEDDEPVTVTPSEDQISIYSAMYSSVHRIENILGNYSRAFTSFTENIASVIQRSNNVSNSKHISENMKSAASKNKSKLSSVGYGEAEDFKQGNSQWGNMPIGTFPNGKKATMKQAGCGPTAMAAIASKFGINNVPTGYGGVSPAQMGRYAMNNGYISQGGANAGLFTEGAARMGLNSMPVSNVNQLRASLRAGMPAVLSGQSSAGQGSTPYTKAGHIVVADGVFGNKARILDPMTGKHRYYGLNNIAKKTNYAWAYSGPAGYGTGNSSDRISLINSYLQEMYKVRDSMEKSSGYKGYNSSPKAKEIYNQYLRKGLTANDLYGLDPYNTNIVSNPSALAKWNSGYKNYKKNKSESWTKVAESIANGVAKVGEIVNSIPGSKKSSTDEMSRFAKYQVNGNYLMYDPLDDGVQRNTSPSGVDTNLAETAYSALTDMYDSSTISQIKNLQPYLDSSRRYGYRSYTGRNGKKVNMHKGAWAANTQYFGSGVRGLNFNGIEIKPVGTVPAKIVATNQEELAKILAAAITMEKAQYEANPSASVDIDATKGELSDAEIITAALNGYRVMYGLGVALEIAYNETLCNQIIANAKESNYTQMAAIIGSLDPEILNNVSDATVATESHGIRNLEELKQIAATKRGLGKLKLIGLIAKAQLNSMLGEGDFWTCFEQLTNNAEGKETTNVTGSYSGEMSSLVSRPQNIEQELLGQSLNLIYKYETGGDYSSVTASDNGGPSFGIGGFHNGIMQSVLKELANAPGISSAGKTVYREVDNWMSGHQDQPLPEDYVSKLKSALSIGSDSEKIKFIQDREAARITYNNVISPRAQGGGLSAWYDSGKLQDLRSIPVIANIANAGPDIVLGSWSGTTNSVFTSRGKSTEISDLRTAMTTPPSYWASPNPNEVKYSDGWCRRIREGADIMSAYRMKFDAAPGTLSEEFNKNSMGFGPAIGFGSAAPIKAKRGINVPFNKRIGLGPDDTTAGQENLDGLGKVGEVVASSTNSAAVRDFHSNMDAIADALGGVLFKNTGLSLSDFGISPKGSSAITSTTSSESTVPGMKGKVEIVPYNLKSRVFANSGCTVTSAYGTRSDNHGGTDVVPAGASTDDIIAHSSGTVLTAVDGEDNNQGSTGNASYGNFIKIKHPNGYYTLYAHMEKGSIRVSSGDTVKTGQIIGHMGNTGNSYGAHLHFEVHDTGDNRVDPTPYLNADLPGLGYGPFGILGYGPADAIINNKSGNLAAFKQIGASLQGMRVKGLKTNIGSLVKSKNKESSGATGLTSGGIYGGTYSMDGERLLSLSGTDRDRYIAAAKSQIGYKEKASNYNIGSFAANAGHNDYSKYGEEFGISGPQGYWCAAFTSWAANAAGIPNNLITRGVGCSTLARTDPHFIDATTGYVPQPGDRILFSESNPNEAYPFAHIGIVESVDGTTVTTIEGNSSDQVIRRKYDYVKDVVNKNAYSGQRGKIAGYMHPDWSGESKTVIPSQILGASAKYEKLGNGFGALGYGIEYNRNKYAKIDTPLQAAFRQGVRLDEDNSHNESHSLTADDLKNLGFGPGMRVETDVDSKTTNKYLGDIAKTMMEWRKESKESRAPASTSIYSKPTTNNVSVTNVAPQQKKSQPSSIKPDTYRDVLFKEHATLASKASVRGS